MEVHHHTHHPKKWREYLTEFLMLFLAVSMGFIAENVREKHTENERSDEFIKSFIIDVKENQKQLDTLIVNNLRTVNYYDSLSMIYGFKREQVDIKKLSESIDLWLYRFTNKKTIFEEMKNSGSLRYIQNKEVLNAILRYEENANQVETRSVFEAGQYNSEFRPTITKVLPISFLKYQSDAELKLLDKSDSTIHKFRYENYLKYKDKISNSLGSTKLSNEQIETLAKAFHLRQERATVGLRGQIELKNQGDKLLKLIEPLYK
jgi:hypothetical protein